MVLSCSENIIFRTCSLPFFFFFFFFSTSATINENSIVSVKYRTVIAPIILPNYIDYIQSHSSMCNQQFVMCEINPERYMIFPFGQIVG